MLIHLYAVHTWSEDAKDDAEAPRANGLTNGHANGNGNGYARANRQIQDAEEFELSGLDSDDEDDEAPGDKERMPLVAQH